MLPRESRGTLASKSLQLSSKIRIVHDCLDRSYDGVNIGRIAIDRGVSAAFFQRWNIRCDNRTPARHGFDRR